MASEAAAESISRAVMKLAAAVAVGIGDETVELTLSHAQLKAHPHTHLAVNRRWSSSRPTST